jgi:hypothetical protein
MEYHLPLPENEVIPISNVLGETNGFAKVSAPLQD